MNREGSSPPDPAAGCARSQSVRDQRDKPTGEASAPALHQAYADLHVHTSASDGLLSPKEVVRLAAAEGFCALSICDHDTVAGLDEGISAAEEAGVELVPGVELSSYLGSTEVHILGYCLDHKDGLLLSTLDCLCRERTERVEKMLGLLRGLGIELDRSAMGKPAKAGSVGRLHVARAMVKQGFVSDTQKAFRKYIGRGRPAYVPRSHVSPGEACRLIRAARGIPVLAHPSLLHKDELIKSLVAEGVMGIEAFYSKITPDVAGHYCRVAKKYGLIVTGGSDCHQNEGDGRLLGTVKLDYKYVAKLKEAAAALSGA